MSELKAKVIHMGAAQCAVDLGDGSEREIGRAHV